MNLRPLALVVALALIAVACGDDDAATTTTTTTGSTTTASPGTTAAPTTTSGGFDPGPTVRFGSSDYPFSIEYPANWESQRDSFGAVIIVLSPLTDSDDQFAENVNVVVEDLGGADLTLDEYVDLAVAQLESFIPGFLISDEFAAEMGDQPSWFIVYTGVQDGDAYKWAQEIALFEGSAYIITYTGAPDGFDLYLPHALAIFESFEFLG